MDVAISWVYSERIAIRRKLIRFEIGGALDERTW